jgi:hypothetical protein
VEYKRNDKVFRRQSQAVSDEINECTDFIFFDMTLFEISMQILEEEEKETRVVLPWKDFVHKCIFSHFA